MPKRERREQCQRAAAERCKRRRKAAKDRFKFTAEQYEAAKKLILRWAKIDPKNPGGCWEWIKGRNHGGYGTLVLNCADYMAHRLSHVVFNGATAEEMKGVLVRHKCHNRGCVNPAHLELGDTQDNSNDMAEAGRLTVAFKPKMTKATAMAIIASASTGMTMKERMQLHGVGRGVIYGIDMGLSWKRLPRPTGWTPPVYRKYTRKPFAGWTAETYEASFEKVKANCTYAQENHPDLGTPCLLPNKRLPNRDHAKVKVNKKRYSDYEIACMYEWRCQKPEGKVVRHLCGTGDCCNPKHLEFGTQQKNCQDTVKMGRHGAAKLDQAKADRIRELHEGGMTRKELATMFSVSPQSIGDVVNEISWASDD